MTAAGTQTSDATKRYRYFYDASRAPWRLAKDAARHCDTRAQAQLAGMNTFFAGQTPAGIREGYTPGGTPLHPLHKAVFVATAGAGAIASGNATFRWRR
jgi:hypothetical protein